MIRFEIFKGSNGQFYFDMRAGNGEKIAQSEGYTRKESATATIALIKNSAGAGEVVDRT